jgi:hypothetical protein
MLHFITVLYTFLCSPWYWRYIAETCSWFAQRSSSVFRLIVPLLFSRYLSVIKTDTLTLLYKARSPPPHPANFWVSPTQNIRLKLKSNSTRLDLHVSQSQHTKHEDTGCSRKKFLTLVKFMAHTMTPFSSKLFRANTLFAAYCSHTLPGSVLFYGTHVTELKEKLGYSLLVI